MTFVYKNSLWNIIDNTKESNSNNIYLVLDTETTGINTTTSYIVQLSYMLVNYKFEQIEAISDYIIKIDQYIPNSYIHGITNKISQSKGFDLIYVFQLFMISLQKATHIICYNIKFDIEMLITELSRLGMFHILNELNSKILVCPMRELKHLVGNPSRYSKLADTYQSIVGKPIEHAHDSKYDVINLNEILYTMYNRFTHLIPRPRETSK